MKTIFPTLLIFTALVALGADEHGPNANTVILDEAGMRNLRIETAVAEPGVFEETVFALGRIDVYPGKRAVISSRIAGRALAVNVRHDHSIEKDAPAIVVESRQFGNPPPQVTLPAPISGLVSAVHIVPGEPIDPDKILAEIIDLSEVYALARVPEHLAGQLKPGQSARLTIPAVPGRVFNATLEHFGAIADPVTGTLEAAFHLENPDLVLRPGMRAEFSIIVSQRSDVTAVPRSAVQGSGANRFVYVKDFDLPNAFIKTPVVTGASNDQSIEIVSGLFPADEVVTRGAYSLSFAGANSISLKEALDAAHGHAHNEDGSEITASSSGNTSAAHNHNHSHDHDHSHHDHDHDHEHEHEDEYEYYMPAWPWMISTGALAIALVFALRRKRSAQQ